MDDLENHVGVVAFGTINEIAHRSGGAVLLCTPKLRPDMTITRPEVMMKEDWPRVQEGPSEIGPGLEGAGVYVAPLHGHGS